ncbi:MAG: winged helix-turn-helix domain-containing protein [Desulfobulbaceae bacterium]
MEDEQHKQEKTKDAGPIACRGRIWLRRAEGTFLGAGRVALLERIHEFGSISKAARSMGMSYKRAWDLVDSMNRMEGWPLVTTTSGGKGGGGAILTERGHRAVNAFRTLEQRFQNFLVEEAHRFLAEFEPEKKS